MFLHLLRLYNNAMAQHIENAYYSEGIMLYFAWQPKVTTLLPQSTKYGWSREKSSKLQTHSGPSVGLYPTNRKKSKVYGWICGHTAKHHCLHCLLHKTWWWPSNPVEDSSARGNAWWYNLLVPRSNGTPRKNKTVKDTPQTRYCHYNLRSKFNCSWHKLSEPGYSLLAKQYVRVAPFKKMSVD